MSVSKGTDERNNGSKEQKAEGLVSRMHGGTVKQLLESNYAN